MNPLIIAGMHRSGTSFTANFLKKSGLNVGSSLLIGSDNPKGHFEDLDFLEFHKYLLNQRGSELTGLNLERTPEGFSQHESEKARNILEKKYQLNGDHLWGWKEPRTTLFLENWKEIWPSINVVAVYRNFYEVVDSLVRREYLKSSHHWNPLLVQFRKVRLSSRRKLLEHTFLKQWILYNEAIVNFWEKHPKQLILFNIDDIHNHPDRMISDLNDMFHLSLQVPEESIFNRRFFKAFDQRMKFSDVNIARAGHLLAKLEQIQKNRASN